MALVVAILATIASVHLFFQTEPTQSAAALDMSAGSVGRDLVERADTATPAPEPIIIQLTLDESASVTRYLEDAGLERAEAESWARQFRKVARTRRMRRGHSLVLYKDPETGDLRGLRYDLSRHIAIRERGLGEGIIRTSRELIQYDVRRISVAFKIERSFRTAAELHNLPEPIVYKLENAFSDTHPLDDLSSGSVVKLIYREKVSHDGTYRLAAGIEAAQIEDGDHVLSAFAFRDGYGHARLFAGNGEELGQLQSLRFPVKFRYISSRFSYHRYHPILHEYRPHLGVDLAARYGTPVKAIADGRVIYAGWCGELGRCVKLKHSDEMISIYGHLSRITAGLRKGASVRMGEVIGRVGSSGLSTGPHLHFALEKRGHFVNPLTQSLGVNHRVSPRMRTLFDRIKEKYLAALSKLPSFGGHFHVSAAAVPGAQTHARRSGRRLASAHRHHRRFHHRGHTVRTALAR